MTVGNTYCKHKSEGEREQVLLRFVTCIFQ